MQSKIVFSLLLCFIFMGCTIKPSRVKRQYIIGQMGYKIERLEKENLYLKWLLKNYLLSDPQVKDQSNNSSGGQILQ